MTVEELGQRLSSSELTEWLAFYNLEPFGGNIDALRIGSVNATLANINKNPKLRMKSYTPKDFAIGFSDDSYNGNKQQTWFNHQKIMNSIAKKHNKKIRKK